MYCKLPVAKRNFAKRHRHAGKIAADDLPRDFDESCDDNLSVSDRGTASATGGKSKLSSSSRGSKRKRCDPQELLEQLAAHNVDEVQQEDGSPKEPFTGKVLESLLKERQEAWAALLLKRPRTKEGSKAMMSWVLEVLRTSDMEESAPITVKVETTAVGAGNEEGDDNNGDENTSGSMEQDTSKDGCSNGFKNSFKGDDEEEQPDDASTSSEDSVDLRASKKPKAL